MKKYLKTAKKRHWLLIIILLSTSFYLPFLIFGAYPFATKINLSEDAKDLMNILMLTNAHYPKINITEKEFLNIKSDWLIKNDNRDLIEDYLIKNQILNLLSSFSFPITKIYSESFISKKSFG